ncbi:MAG: DUF6452 family protein [Bacteroidales bacterium]
MKKHFIIILTFSLALVISSCSDDRCHLDTETLLNAKMSIEDPDTPKNFVDSLSVYSPEWTDSIHYKTDGTGKSLLLMLSPNTDTTAFIFTSNLVDNSDTITFFYQRDFVLLSAECGFVVHFEIDSIANTWNYIDSLKLVKNQITTNEQGHIQIYF